MRTRIQRTSNVFIQSFCIGTTHNFQHSCSLPTLEKRGTDAEPGLHFETSFPGRMRPTDASTAVSRSLILFVARDPSPAPRAQSLEERNPKLRRDDDEAPPEEGSRNKTDGEIAGSTNSMYHCRISYMVVICILSVSKAAVSSLSSHGYSGMHVRPLIAAKTWCHPPTADAVLLRTSEPWSVVSKTRHGKCCGICKQRPRTDVPASTKLNMLVCNQTYNR